MIFAMRLSSMNTWCPTAPALAPETQQRTTVAYVAHMTAAQRGKTEALVVSDNLRTFSTDCGIGIQTRMLTTAAMTPGAAQRRSASICAAIEAVPPRKWSCVQNSTSIPHAAPSGMISILLSIAGVATCGLQWRVPRIHADPHVLVSRRNCRRAMRCNSARDFSRRSSGRR